MPPSSLTLRFTWEGHVLADILRELPCRVCTLSYMALIQARRSLLYRWCVTDRSPEHKRRSRSAWRAASRRMEYVVSSVVRLIAALGSA
jgi:hypothetical protein